MKDSDLEAMGFIKLLPWSKKEWDWAIQEHRLIAGVHGAKEAIFWLKEAARQAKDLKLQTTENKALDAIQNLKKFLGES